MQTIDLTVLAKDYSSSIWLEKSELDLKCSKSSQCSSQYFGQKANVLLPLILLTQMTICVIRFYEVPLTFDDN